jgi:hypothetical protein
VDGETPEAVGGSADNLNGFSASTAAAFAFNNPARHSIKGMSWAEGGVE